MRNQPTLVLLSIASFTLVAISACGSSREDADVSVEDNGPSIEAKPNPCGMIKCPDAKHCESHGKHATCADDPACTTDADCYLFAGYCSGPYACTCSAHENSVRIGCTTSIITCPSDPCSGVTAACVNGSCARVSTP